MRRRHVFGVAIALVITLTGLHVGYWFWAAHLLETGLSNWVARQRALGWSVTAGTPERGGWPLRATMLVTGVNLSGKPPRMAEAVTWQAERVLLRVDLLRPDVLHVHPEGAQYVRIGTGPIVPFQTERLRLGFPLRATVHGWMELDAGGLHASLPQMGPDRPAGDLRAQALMARADVAPSASVGAALVARAEAMTVPDWVAPGLGGQIEAVRLNIALTGRLPQQASPRAAATAWRDNNGRLDVSQLQLHWGVLALNATASLSLDAQLQPSGSGKLRISGHAAALDALAGAGLVPANTAGAAKGVLALAARPTGPDGAPEVDLPLSLQRRTLAVRQFPLVQLPAVTWPP